MEGCRSGPATTGVGGFGLRRGDSPRSGGGTRLWRGRTSVGSNLVRATHFFKSLICVIFLLRNIDINLYLAHEYTSYCPEPHRKDPPNPAHGARIPLHYPSGAQRSLLQPQLLGERQKPLPLSAPRHSPAGPTG